MAWVDPKIGSPLTYEEVKRLVEASSPSIELCFEAGGRERYLVAKKALKSGEVLLSESPLFCGRIDGAQSRRACKDEFAALAKEVIDEGREGDYEDEDCMHPCSPLIDCLSGIVLMKSQALLSKDIGDCARAKLKVRQFATLARSCATEELSDEAAQDILDLFSSELTGLLGKDELRGMIRAISSNRFSGMGAQLDLMFAGSMFEHSCMPNCFAGNWRQSVHKPRLYRALRDIEAGEVLSISYLQLPELYLPTAQRAELLAAWGFSCSCPRCTSLPELVRAFVCPACSAPELCPSRPGPDVREFQCLKCQRSPEEAYVERCLKLEAVLDRLAEGVEEPLPSGGGEAAAGNNDNVIGRFHHAAFRASWQAMQEGPSRESLFAYACAIEDLIQCITRLNDDPRHPSLLELYHIMAELETGHMDGQQHYLGLEHATLLAHYPDLAERQDDEIMNLIQGRGPHTALPKEADLSEMD